MKGCESDKIKRRGDFGKWQISMVVSVSVWREMMGGWVEMKQERTSRVL